MYKLYPHIRKHFTKHIVVDTSLLKRNFCLNKVNLKSIILGIETSCDDTGCAVVDSEGILLGDALESQHLVHLNNGGIIPPIAQNLHREHIENVVQKAIDNANVSFDDIDAIAVTVKPGLPLSLIVGMKYGKYLCRLNKKPFIPIHHMEAHALTARMHDRSIEYPFLVLLISGGHCLIAVVKNVDEFLLMGESLDDAPGEAFDKMSRRMQLKNIPEFSEMSGGQAIELAASRATDPLKFKFKIPLLQYRDCNFSMAGIKNQVWRHIVQQEKYYDVPPDGVIPDFYNLCAGFQLTVAGHLCHRIQRAMEFVRLNELIPPNKQTLVVSGGAACNNFINKALQIVCTEMEYKLVRPPSKLCTDNGIMIAWNGVERWNANVGVSTDLESISIERCSPLGRNIIDQVKEANLRCKWVKLKTLYNTQTEDDLQEGLNVERR